MKDKFPYLGCVLMILAVVVEVLLLVLLWNYTMTYLGLPKMNVWLAIVLVAVMNIVLGFLKRLRQ